MIENERDFVLDGNAAAGALREVFAAGRDGRAYSMRRMRLGRSRGFSALLCSSDGSRVKVQQLRGHPPEGGPHAAWPLAGNEGARAASEVASGHEGREDASAGRIDGLRQIASFHSLRRLKRLSSGSYRIDWRTGLFNPRARRHPLQPGWKPVGQLGRNADPSCASTDGGYRIDCEQALSPRTPSLRLVGSARRTDDALACRRLSQRPLRGQCAGRPISVGGLQTRKDRPAWFGIARAGTAIAACRRRSTLLGRAIEGSDAVASCRSHAAGDRALLPSSDIIREAIDEVVKGLI